MKDANDLQLLSLAIIDDMRSDIPQSILPTADHAFGAELGMDTKQIQTVENIVNVAIGTITSPFAKRIPPNLPQVRLGAFPDLQLERN